MESANLTKAHEHVRNAATATFSNSIVTAGAEHEYAATAFHDAAHDTHNDEALRILSLLEDHHLKLASLIKEPPRKKDYTKDAAASSPTDTSTDSPPSKSSTSRTASPSSSTRAPPRRRLPQSSIASNLAEKRGIPGVRRSTPSASSVSVTNALATRNDSSPSPSVRDMLQQQHSRNPEASENRDEDPASGTKSKSQTVRQDTSPPPDANFRRFYSAFGGVISAISAPLAFTSLPLNPLSSSTTLDQEQQPSSKPKSRSKATKPDQQQQPLDASRTIKSPVPDLTSVISKPALRALQEDQTVPLGPFANNESFYFVPTSGGTVSYANILRDPQGHPHLHPHHAAQDPNLDSIAEGDNESGLRGSSHEEFVDARENVGPPSPTHPRRPRSKGNAPNAASTTPLPTGGVTNASSIRAGRGQGLKTLEELQLENETLRALIDKQSKRLSMWETTSQSSYNALAQSFRARSAGVKQQLSDPSALAQALAMGANAVPAPASPPPVPSIPQQYQDGKQQSGSTGSQRQAADNAKRIAELEAMLASQSTQIDELTTEKEQLTKQNDKHTQVIGRYREQWEKLKAGARKKEQERRERRVAELRAGAEQGKDSESGEATGDGEEAPEGDEPGFGKA